MSPTLATAIAWATFHTLMIFWPFGQQVVQLAIPLAPALVVVVPAAGAVGVAAGAAARARDRSGLPGPQPSPAYPAGRIGHVGRRRVQRRAEHADAAEQLARRPA
jgi:hypothetical protein